MHVLAKRHRDQRLRRAEPRVLSEQRQLHRLREHRAARQTQRKRFARDPNHEEARKRGAVAHGRKRAPPTRDLEQHRDELGQQRQTQCATSNLGEQRQRTPVIGPRNCEHDRGAHRDEQEDSERGCASYGSALHEARIKRSVFAVAWQGDELFGPISGRVDGAGFSGTLRA